jgi:glycosyltransferase involved in cell wall biosynthesis
MRKVSVVIPAYNKADLTAKTVKSVLNQTYPDIEVIVVDDGSTDNTRKRLSCFGDKIRYVYKQGGGACNARNLGIRLATGDYIGFLDCDDMYLPQKMEKSVDCLDRNLDFGFVHTPVYYMDKNDTILRTCHLYKRQREGWIAKGLILGNFICNSTVVVRKSCFKKVGIFDETIFIPADWDMWLRLAEQYKAGYIHTPLTLYRISENYTLRHLDQSRREELIVAEKAIRRNSGMHPLFEDRLISNVHYRHGICYLSVNDFDKTKEELTLSVRKYIYNLKALFLLITIIIIGKKFKLIKKYYHNIIRFFYGR